MERKSNITQILHELLSVNGLTLATAESCTGGCIASGFTSLAGASEYFLGGVVAYSNSMKSQLLGVAPALIDQNGAVSEPVVRAMAEGAKRVSGADYAVATSGVAGPGGGTPQKPIGMVWMAIATPSGCISFVEMCGHERHEIVERASRIIQERLLEEIKKSLSN